MPLKRQWRVTKNDIRISPCGMTSGYKSKRNVRSVYSSQYQHAGRSIISDYPPGLVSSWSLQIRSTSVPSFPQSNRNRDLLRRWDQFPGTIHRYGRAERIQERIARGRGTGSYPLLESFVAPFWYRAGRMQRKLRCRDVWVGTGRSSQGATHD